MIIADTNVVSELMRPAPAPSVLRWITGVDADQLGITTVTVAEIEYGLARLPEGRRQRDLAAKWRQILETYEKMIIGYGVGAAHATADVLIERDRLGRPISLADAQIAGICQWHKCVLATRYTKDFGGIGLQLTNPFEMK